MGNIIGARLKPKAPCKHTSYAPRQHVQTHSPNSWCGPGVASGCTPGDSHCHQRERLRCAHARCQRLAAIVCGWTFSSPPYGRRRAKVFLRTPSCHNDLREANGFASEVATIQLTPCTTACVSLGPRCCPRCQPRWLHTWIADDPDGCTPSALLRDLGSCCKPRVRRYARHPCALCLLTAST